MNRSIYILLFLLASCTGTQQNENEISDSSTSAIQDDTSPLKDVPEFPKTKLITCNGIGSISLSDNMADKKIRSDHTALQKYNPRLSVIRLSRKN